MRDHTNPGPETSLSIAPGLGNVLFDVWLVSRAVHALVDDAIRSAGLDADEYAIYSVLASGDPMTPTELAHWMAAPPTTVSSYIKRFEKRGHMVRVTNPDDGRSHRVQLTAEGQQAHKQASRLYQPVLAEVEQCLDEQAEQTHQRLQALHQVIDALRTRPDAEAPAISIGPGVRKSEQRTQSVASAAKGRRVANRPVYFSARQVSR